MRGDNFANGALCHFGYTDGGGLHGGRGSAAPVPATFYAVDRVACVAPPRAAGVGSVTLALSPTLTIALTLALTLPEP